MCVAKQIRSDEQELHPETRHLMFIADTSSKSKLKLAIFLNIFKKIEVRILPYRFMT